MMLTSAIPVPKPSDDEEVSWALSTAAALWTRGSQTDAIKWLRRAAQTANDLEDDGRAVELYKVAADLASSVPPDAPSASRPSGAVTTPPPSDVRLRAEPVMDPPGTIVRPSGAPPPPPSARVAPPSAPPPGAPPPSVPPAVVYVANSGSQTKSAVAPSSSPPPPSSRPATLLPPPMAGAPEMVAPPSTPAPVIATAVGTPLPEHRSAPPPPLSPSTPPFARTPSAPPPPLRRSGPPLSQPPPEVALAPEPPLEAEVEVEPELDVEAATADFVRDFEPEVENGSADAEAASEPLDGFHARVMIIPTSRRGELRLVVVPPGNNPEPDTLTGVLVPSAQHAETIRALLYGAG